MILLLIEIQNKMYLCLLKNKILHFGFFHNLHNFPASSWQKFVNFDKHCFESPQYIWLNNRKVIQ